MTAPERHEAVANDAEAAEVLRGLAEQQAAIAHELTVAVGLVKAAGWSWSDVAAALAPAAGGGFGATKQAAAQRFRTAFHEATEAERAAEWDDEAAAYLNGLRRRLTIRERAPRWEVRREDGAVNSWHRSEPAAVAACHGDGWTVWRVDPRRHVPDRRTL